MDIMGPPRRQWSAEVFTDEFIIKGQLEPLGQLVDFLNDPRQDCLPVTEAVFNPMEPDNPLNPLAIPEIILSKQKILFISLLTRADREAIPMLPNKQPIIAYTRRFVLRAVFRLGGDMRIRDVFDAFTATFLPVQDASLFPLFTPKIPLAKTHPLLLVNKRHILTYYADRG
jgi:hypothetical protein